MDSFPVWVLVRRSPAAVAAPWSATAIGFQNSPVFGRDPSAAAAAAVAAAANLIDAGLYPDSSMCGPELREAARISANGAIVDRDRIDTERDRVEAAVLPYTWAGGSFRVPANVSVEWR